MLRRRELDILYVATRAALLFLLPLYISDLGLYQDYARKLIPGGQFPYVGFDFEYPPLAYPLMALPAWLLDALGQKDTETYRLLFGLCLLPLDFLLFRGFRRRPPFPGAAFLYVLLTSALGLLIFDRFDLAVGFLIAWPFVGEWPKGELRYALSWGLGGALKLVPLLLAPARVLEWSAPWREKALRAVKFLFVAAAPVALCLGAVAAAAHGKISFLSHHSDRGVQIESLVGSIVMFLQAFTKLVSTKVEWNFGAQHLAPIPGVVAASRALFYGSLAGAYAALAMPSLRRDTLTGAWLLISGFVTFGYVLSPQFLLWLVPIGICAAGRVERAHRSLWLTVFAAVIVITGMHFRFYWDYVNLHRQAVAMLLLRNLLLVALWGLSWVWMGRTAKEQGSQAAPLGAKLTP